MRPLGLVLILLALTAGWFVRTSPATAGEVRVPIGPYGSGLLLSEEVKSVKELREEGVVLQQRDFSCGSAALATIFTYHLNLPCTEQEVIAGILEKGDLNALAVHRGFSLLDLKQYAESRGVKAVGYQLTFELLSGVHLPVLLPLYIEEQKIRHFVVYLGTDGDQVFIADPSAGRRTLSVAEFTAQWNPTIGMIFSREEMPPLADTPLAVRPQDKMTLPEDSVIGLALLRPFPYFPIHNEY